MPAPLVDDIWGNDDDASPSNAHAAAELDREWRARREEFWNSGYREGLEAGKHETVQEGFDEGYSKGALSGYEWGVIRGAALTLQAAAVKGMVSIESAAAAAEAINALAPGEVQDAECRRLIQTNASSTVTPSEAKEEKMEEKLSVSDAAKRQVAVVIEELGFTLATRHDKPQIDP